MRLRQAPIPRALLAAALAVITFPAAAVAQVAVFDGHLHATGGGFRFGDGTLQTTAATGSAAYGAILVVDHRGGGDYTSIQTAIDAVGNTLPAANASNPYLVRVAPGVYSEQVTMKQWVDLEGAGEGATTITWVGAADSASAHTIETSRNAELRFLTVENTGGAAYAHGVSVGNGDPTERVYRVTADTSGGTTSTVGVRIFGTGAPLLRKVTAIAASGPSGRATAFHISTGSPTLLGANATVSGDGTIQAIRITSSAAPTIRGGIAKATGTAGSQTAVELGSASATITGLTMIASGGRSANALRSAGTPSEVSTVQGSRLEASGTDFSAAVLNLTAQPLRIHGSAIVAPSGDALDAHPGSEIDIASSLVDGAIAAGGTYVCFASFDGSFSAIGADCT